MKEAKSSLSGIIDWERYEKMTLVEKWAYLNEKIKEIDERVRKILHR